MNAKSPGFSAFSWVVLALFGLPTLLVGIAHVRYPGFTEPMEGDVLQHVERAATGQPLYPAPGAEFIALSYTPLYYLAAAPSYRLWPDSLFGPRLLSALAALGSATMVGLVARRETGSRSAGILAVALFAGAYRVMDACLFCAL